MKKFGFGSKSSSGGGGDEESTRSGLFGRKNKSSPAPQKENPYGQEPANDPYTRPNANPYQQNSGGLPSGPRGGAGRGGLPGGPGPRTSSGGPPPPYSGTPSGGSGGYGSEKYGASGGYGGNRYDDGKSGGQNSYGSGPGAMKGGPQGGYSSQTSQRAGGYGGMGGNSGSGGREALFEGASSRYAQKQQGQAYGGGQQSDAQDSYDGYGAPRELTEEEQEQQDLRNTTGEIKRVQQDSIATLQRTEDTLDRAIEVGMGTYQKLAQQQDRLANTEKNLDLAMEQSRHGSNQADELKHLNRSLWNPGMRNPIKRDSSKAVQEARAQQQFQQDNNIRADTRANAFSAHSDMENKMNQIQEAAGRGRLLGSGAGKRKDLQFEFEEDDEERNELENNEGDIDERMDRLGQKLGVVRLIAGAQSDAVAAQTPLIDRIHDKTEAVDSNVDRNNRKLANISKRA